jgi:hypothetical protein
LPEGKCLIKANQSSETIAGFIGLLSDRTNKVTTIEEINDATMQAWAGN